MLFEEEELIQNCTDPGTGEFDSEKFLYLSSKNMSDERKIKSLSASYKTDMAKITAFKDEAERISKRIKTLENNAKRKKIYLSSLLNGQPFEDESTRISFRKSQRVYIDIDVRGLPADYVTIDEQYKPNKDKIKRALKQGKQINGCELLEINNIIIK